MGTIGRGEARDWFAAYTTLGLDPTSSTPAIVKTRFKELALERHPDRLGLPPGSAAYQKANDGFRPILEAFQLLREANYPVLRLPSGNRFEGTAIPTPRPRAPTEGVFDSREWRSHTWWIPQPDPIGDPFIDDFLSEVDRGAPGDYSHFLLSFSARLVFTLAICAVSASCSLLFFTAQPPTRDLWGWAVIGLVIATLSLIYAARLLRRFVPETRRLWRVDRRSVEMQLKNLAIVLLLVAVVVALFVIVRLPRY